MSLHLKSKNLLISYISIYILICFAVRVMTTTTTNEKVSITNSKQAIYSFYGKGQNYSNKESLVYNFNKSNYNEKTIYTECKTATNKQIIGILTQVLRDYKRFVKDKHLHIAASYIKWIESTGAQVMPILLNQNDSYYEKVFHQTNGLLFPGGDNLLDPNKRTPMMVAAKKLYSLAVEANDHGDYYPIWGTCLGLELLTTLTANKNVLSSCSANDLALPMEIVNRGKIFATRDIPGMKTGFDYSKAIVDLLHEGNLTYNFHHFCFDDQGLKKAGLENFYHPLAYSYDKNGQKFITIFEAYKYPFYGVQFHPEKPPFEFVVKKDQAHIPHGNAAITVSRFFADFFSNQARLNKHCSNDPNLINELIYSYNPIYTGSKGDIYEQRYLFPYKESDTISDEEFIDHIPEEDEEIPE